MIFILFKLSCLLKHYLIIKKDWPCGLPVTKVEIFLFLHTGLPSRWHGSLWSRDSRRTGSNMTVSRTGIPRTTSTVTQSKFERGVAIETDHYFRRAYEKGNLYLPPRDVRQVPREHTEPSRRYATAGSSAPWVPQERDDGYVLHRDARRSVCGSRLCQFFAKDLRCRNLNTCTNGRMPARSQTPLCWRVSPQLWCLRWFCWCLFFNC